MMIDEARAAAASHFITEWGATTPFLIEDEQWDSPGVGEPGDPPADKWVRFVVRHQGFRPGAVGPQVNLGGPGTRKFERRAAVMIQIFTRVDEGSVVADQLAKQALAAFEVEGSITGLKFEGGEIRESGRDGNQRMTLVEVPFYYEETK